MEQGDRTEGHSRRELLRKLGVAAGALVWSTPVVQTIAILTADAQQGCSDVSHLDLVVCRGSGCSQKYGITWDPGSGWSKHSSSQAHCLTGSWTAAPGSFSFSGFPTPTFNNATGSYTVTLPADVKVWQAYSKAGQGCQPAVNTSGTTWRFDKWCSGATTTTSTTAATTTTTAKPTTTTTAKPTTTTTAKPGDDCDDSNSADSDVDRSDSDNSDSRDNSDDKAAAAKSGSRNDDSNANDNDDDDSDNDDSDDSHGTDHSSANSADDDCAPPTTTTTTAPSTTTSSTTSTTTVGGGGGGSPAPGKDISHMDWILCRGSGCNQRYAVQYEFGSGWGKHPSSNTNSQHCLAGLSWSVPPNSFSFSGFGSAVSLGGRSYRITLPADVKVWSAFSKCGQECRPATHLGGNSWRFDPC